MAKLVRAGRIQLIKPDWVFHQGHVIQYILMAKLVRAGYISPLLQQKRIKHRLGYGSMARGRSRIVCIKITDWCEETYLEEKERRLSKIEPRWLPGFCYVLVSKFPPTKPFALSSASLKPILWNSGREGERRGVASQRPKYPSAATRTYGSWKL
uniref:Uncharacterized protein n=1 Tax=Timema tahoe TaxID=61484 RepID=A0A7R9IQQ4_9NEOP|nr:unnamed protein product [Timema tahoe]